MIWWFQKIPTKDQRSTKPTFWWFLRLAVFVVSMAWARRMPVPGAFLFGDFKLRKAKGMNPETWQIFKVPSNQLGIFVVLLFSRREKEHVVFFAWTDLENYIPQSCVFSPLQKYTLKGGWWKLQGQKIIADKVTYRWDFVTVTPKKEEFLE